MPAGSAPQSASAAACASAEQAAAQEAERRPYRAILGQQEHVPDTLDRAGEPSAMQRAYSGPAENMPERPSGNEEAAAQAAESMLCNARPEQPHVLDQTGTISTTQLACNDAARAVTKHSLSHRESHRESISATVAGKSNACESDNIDFRDRANNISAPQLAHSDAAGAVNMHRLSQHENGPQECIPATMAEQYNAYGPEDDADRDTVDDASALQSHSDAAGAVNGHGISQHESSHQDCIPATLAEADDADLKEGRDATDAAESVIENSHEQQKNGRLECISATLADMPDAIEAHEAGGHAAPEIPPTLPDELNGPQQAAASSQEVPALMPAALQGTVRGLEPTLVLQSQPPVTLINDEHTAVGGSGVAAPAGLRDTLRDMESVIVLESQPAHAMGIDEQSSPRARARVVNETNAAMWSTASGKPVQVSAEAMRAAQFKLALEDNADDEQSTGQQEHRAAEDMCQPLHSSQEHALSAEHGDVPYAHDTTEAYMLQGQAPSMHSPSQQETSAEDDISTGLAQAAPASAPQAAEVQANGHTNATFSGWGTASGKPVHFSMERMRAAAAAVFGDDFPIGLTPDAAASVTLSTGSGEFLQGAEKERPDATAARGPADANAATPSKIDPGKHMKVSPGALAGAASRLQHAAGESDAALARGNAEAGTATAFKTASGKHVRVTPEALAAAFRLQHEASESDATPARGNAEAGAAIHLQTASGKRVRMSPEGLNGAACTVHHTAGPVPGQSAVETPPSLTSGAKGSRGSMAESGSPAQQNMRSDTAVAENSTVMDPVTPMPQQPAGRDGQLSASTSGRRRSAQQSSGLGQSRGRTGSTFKAPRKFMTPVRKFALQQVCQFHMNMSSASLTIISLRVVASSPALHCLHNFRDVLHAHFSLSC